MLFWYSNPQVRVPVNNRMTEIMEEEHLDIIAEEYEAQRTARSIQQLPPTEGSSIKDVLAPPISSDRQRRHPPLSIVESQISNYSKRTTQILKSKSVKKLFKRFLTKFTIKYVLLLIFNMTTSSAYLCAISFQTTFLNIYYELPYMTAKDIELFQPAFFIIVVLIWIFGLSRYVKSDGVVLFFSAAIMTANFLKTYFYDEKNYALAILHVVLHGVAGALYQSVFWAAVCKNLPPKFEGIAISFISLANNAMNSVAPIITGHIIGKEMTKTNAKYCIIWLVSLSGVGCLTGLFYMIKENPKKIEQEEGPGDEGEDKGMMEEEQ